MSDQHATNGTAACHCDELPEALADLTSIVDTLHVLAQHGAAELAASVRDWLSNLSHVEG